MHETDIMFVMHVEGGSDVCVWWICHLKSGVKCAYVSHPYVFKTGIKTHAVLCGLVDFKDCHSTCQVLQPN